MPRINPETGEVVVTLDQDGRELVDPNPVEVPAGKKRPETLAEQVKRLVRTSLSAHAEMKGYETFEESEDFDIEDDEDPWSPHEVQLFNGFEVTPHDFADGSAEGQARLESLKKAYLAAIRTEGAAADFQHDVDEAYKRARKAKWEAKNKRGAGVSPAPSSSEAPKGPPPAEPQASK